MTRATAPIQTEHLAGGVGALRAWRAERMGCWLSRGDAQHVAEHVRGHVRAPVRRCVVDVRRTCGTWGTRLAGYSHHGTYELPDDQPPPAPGEQVTARFTLPSGAGGTDLHGRHPVHWELLIEGRTSCGLYSETFPVPIYDAPPAAATPTPT